MLLHLNLVGVLLIVLSLMHIAFKKYFKWTTELSSLNLLNRQMMTVHTFFIALTVFLMGVLCLTSARELIETNLGRRICFGLALFWTIRLFVQFFIYSQEHWRGKRFETWIHILFVCLWIYFSGVFWVAATN